MKIQELKEELRLLGEKTGGSKAELVARLEAANKRARDESEKLERGEISGALVLYDGDFAGQQQGDESEEPEEWQQDQYTPLRKRFKQGCDCYRCTGETFSVEGPRGSSIHAEATSICATMRCSSELLDAEHE